MDKDRFAKGMFLLATECAREITPQTMDLYHNSLAPYGYEKTCRAIAEILKTRRSNEPFPTIQEIIDRMDGGGDVDQIANRIAGAITKFGSYRHEEARAYIGELGWQLVSEGGGWSRLCLSKADQIPYLKGQWARALQGYKKELQQYQLGPRAPREIGDGDIEL